MAEITADSLYIDPTPAYAGTLQNLEAQSSAATDRYKENTADVKNIFGSLTTLASADAARINEQFTKSIADQQAALAARTAEARAGVKAGTAQAAATGAERGGGPAMNVNPISTAAEEGIARSNAYQTVWENLMKANAAQSVQDTAARGRGYKQQELATQQALSKNLEDVLLKIGGQTTAVKADIAKAKLAARQQVVNTKYQEAQTAKENAARAAAAAAKAAAKPKSYPKGITGWAERVDDKSGPGRAQSIQQVVAKVAKAVETAKKKTNPQYRAKAGDVIAALSRSEKYANSPSLTDAIEYVNQYSGLGK